MVTISRSLNLTGTPCPMNFVLLKQALDAMPQGECLEARLDGGSTGVEVVESLAGCGYDVVTLEQTGDVSRVVVRRRNASRTGFMSIHPRRGGGCTKANRRHR